MQTLIILVVDSEDVVFFSKIYKSKQQLQDSDLLWLMYLYFFKTM